MAMGERRAVVLLVAVCLAALLVPFTRLDAFVTSDSWERERVAQEILSTGFLPEKNTAYAPEVPYLYPPAFDLLVAGGLAWVGDYLLVLKVLSLAVGLAFAFFTYLLSKRFFRPEIAVMSAFFAFFMPRLFRLLLQPIPETLGLLLFVAALYFAARNKPKLAGLIAAGLLFYHTRSFVNLLIVAALLFHAVSGTKGLKRLKYLIVFPLVLSPLYWLQKIPAVLQSSTLLNPFLSEWSLLQTFGPAAVLAVFYLLFWGQYKRYKPLVHWMGAFILVYAFGTLTGNKTLAFREMAYAFVPIGLLSAALLWRLKAVNRWIIPFALLFSLGYCFYLNFNPGYPLEKEGVAALGFLAGNGPILSDYVTGYGIPLAAGNKAVIGAFLENLPDGNQRLADARRFLETRTPGEAQGILRKYGARLTLLGRTATRQWLGFPVDFDKFGDPAFNKTYDNGTSQAFALN